jgi:hypothetical protein
MIERNVAAFAGMALIAGLRIAAIHWRLNIPVYRLPRAEKEN